MKDIVFKKMDGSKLRIGIVYARWNEEIPMAMLEKAKQGLLDSGVKEKNVIEMDVPGTYELPFGADILIRNNNVDAVICLGALIKGETMHFEYISDAVSSGIMKVQLETHTPVVYGVLNCLTGEQALARSTGDESFAYEWGLSAVEMALLNQK